MIIETQIAQGPKLLRKHILFKNAVSICFSAITDLNYFFRDWKVIFWFGLPKVENHCFQVNNLLIVFPFTS